MLPIIQSAFIDWSDAWTTLKNVLNNKTSTMPMSSEQVTVLPQTESVIDWDNHWMAQAVAEAKLAGIDVPIGCVLVSDNVVIARGHNQKEKTQDPSDHAEIVVLRQAAVARKSWRMNGTTLYTTLEPCPMCAEAIIQARVSRLVFGAYDLKSGAVGSAFNLFIPGRIYPIPEVVGGLAEEECKKLIVDFFATKRIIE
jgi:tRNA(adenine34) deaminase